MKYILILLLLLPFISDSGETKQKLSIQNVNELVIGQEYDVSIMIYKKYTEPEKYIYIGNLTLIGESSIKLTKGILKTGLVIIR